MADDGKTTAAKEEAPTYHVDRLIAEADDRLGVPGHVAAGAFTSLRKQNLTIAEAKKAVDDWLKRPVEVDNDLNPTTTEDQEG